MPRRFHSSESIPKPITPVLPDSSPSGGPSNDRVRRFANPIAEGRSGIPADLQPPNSNRLSAAVRRQLKDRRARYVARAIALQRYGEAGDRQEDNRRVSPQV